MRTRLISIASAGLLALAILGFATAANATPGCQTSTWVFTFTDDSNGISRDRQATLVRCTPQPGDHGHRTLTGNAIPVCIEITGTNRGNDVSMVWQTTGTPGCPAEIATLTGTLKWALGIASGTYDDSLSGPGTWTASRS